MNFQFRAKTPRSQWSIPAGAAAAAESSASRKTGCGEAWSIACATCTILFDWNIATS